MIHKKCNILFGIAIKNVSQLFFGNNFNQDISQVDFKNITTLGLGKNFNQDISKVDLSNISTLSIGFHSIQHIINICSNNNVRYLDIHSQINHDWLNVICSELWNKLEVLTIWNCTIEDFRCDKYPPEIVYDFMDNEQNYICIEIKNKYPTISKRKSAAKI